MEKIFLTCFYFLSYQTFWKHYGKITRPTGHYHATSSTQFRILPFAYEVIIEDLPLNLYVDIEGSKETNPDIDIPLLFLDLLEELKFFLSEMDLAPNQNVSELSMIIMDSSTNKKFSKHLMIKIPECLFKNNYNYIKDKSC